MIMMGCHDDGSLQVYEMDENDGIDDLFTMDIPILSYAYFVYPIHRLDCHDISATLAGPILSCLG